MTKYVIETVNLTKDHVSHFLRKRFRGLDSLNLQVAQGETYGLLGPNGAGKTTTIKLLLGLLRPTSGNAFVLGMQAGSKKAFERIGFLPENPYFYNHLTGVEFLDFAAQMFGQTKTERQDRIKELLELVSLTGRVNRPIRKFSKGMMQRLGIAQSLINDPDVLFWDEPTSGLDPIGRRDVRQIILKLKEKGKTIFFNSHLLPDVHEVCDRVGVLNNGVMVAEDKISDITKSGGYKDLEEYFLTQLEKSASASAHS